MDIQAECADGIGIQIMAAASIPAGVTLVAFEIPGWVIYIEWADNQTMILYTASKIY